ncbi:unnamed protein product [Ilex paraguariensis]|uniref:Uncharacterized protein n=1 Tax=Ilex paraguariensis TaxID=185542 RepID=A0ABC8R361_9AQUA
MWRMETHESSFRESIKALEADDFQHASNSLCYIYFTSATRRWPLDTPCELTASVIGHVCGVAGMCDVNHVHAPFAKAARRELAPEIYGFSLVTMMR